MTATGTAPARTPLDAGRLRARLAAGEPTVGTFLGMASPVAAGRSMWIGVDSRNVAWTPKSLRSVAWMTSF